MSKSAKAGLSIALTVGLALFGVAAGKPTAAEVTLFCIGILTCLLYAFSGWAQANKKAPGVKRIVRWFVILVFASGVTSLYGWKLWPAPAMPTPIRPYDLSSERKTQFENALKRQNEPKVPVRVACDNHSEDSCLAAAKFLLAISEAGWNIDSNKVFRMEENIPSVGVSLASNDPNAAKYPNLPPHKGFWHAMSASEITFYYALQSLGISTYGTNDRTLPVGEIGIYFGPEPQGQQ